MKVVLVLIGLIVLNLSLAYILTLVALKTEKNEIESMNKTIYKNIQEKKLINALCGYSNPKVCLE